VPCVAEAPTEKLTALPATADVSVGCAVIVGGETIVNTAEVLVTWPLAFETETANCAWSSVAVTEFRV